MADANQPELAGNLARKTSALGSVMQTAAALSAIAVAFLGLLETLDKTKLEELELTEMIALIKVTIASVAVLTLLASSLSLVALRERALQEEEPWHVRGSFALLLIGILILGLAVFFFAFDIGLRGHN